MGKGKQRFDWVKAFQPEQDWTKAELETALYWLRQILAVVVGLAFGLVPVTGAVGNILFAVLYLTSTFAYFRFLKLDQDEFSPWDMMTEGGMPSYANFLVSWITAYSLVHA